MLAEAVAGNLSGCRIPLQYYRRAVFAMVAVPYSSLASSSLLGSVFSTQGNEDDTEPHRTQAQPEHGLIGSDRRVSMQFWKTCQQQSADLLIDGTTEPEKEVEDPHGGGDHLGGD
jgi:hypothetical protein